MSEAFVRESDEHDEEGMSPALRIPSGAKNYITPAGHLALKMELEHLVKRERPQVVEIVAWAASNGDRSENGDYIYGKRRLREIDRRIRFLTKRLEIAEVIDPLRQGDNDQIFFGATVTLEEENGEARSYTIVGVDEADVSRGRISWVSPLARALIKAREGDTIRFQSPQGVRDLEILDVRYQPIEAICKE